MKFLKINKKFYLTDDKKEYFDGIHVIEEKDEQRIISYFKRENKDKIATFKYEYQAANFVYGSVLHQPEQMYNAKIIIDINE